MADGINLEGIKHLPKWAWVVGLVGAAGVAFLYTRSSSTPAGASSGVSLPGSTDTSTPSGGQCPAYAQPQCPAGETITYTTDSNNCPLPICGPGQPTGGCDKPNNYVTTDGKTSTWYGLSQIGKDWGEGTIKFYAATHGYPQAATFGYDQTLPAGWYVKIGGCS